MPLLVIENDADSADEARRRQLEVLAADATLDETLEEAGIPILGTSPDAIDLAEDRERFQKLVNDLKLRQPENGIAHSAAEARDITARGGLPVVIRPSYVLGGRAMEVVHHEADLERYMRDAVVV